MFAVKFLLKYNLVFDFVEQCVKLQHSEAGIVRPSVLYK